MMWEKTPTHYGGQERELLNRLAEMAKGYDPTLKAYLTPEQQYAAVAHYTALKEKLLSLEHAAARERDQQAVSRAQAEAATLTAKAAIETAQVARERVEADERVARLRDDTERLRIAQDAQHKADQLYLEEQRIIVRKAELWIQAIETVARIQNPDIAKKMLAVVEDMGRKLTEPARLIEEKKGQ